MKTQFKFMALFIAAIAPLSHAFMLQAQGTETKSEEASLAFFYEEEKMARDVYTVLAKKWGDRPFGNIARAEQMHMDSVSTLMLRKGIKVSLLKPGKFGNEELQKLYLQYEKKGLSSRTEALRVGAAIEDRDIYDLDQSLKTTKDTDTKKVYEALRAGSANHLRAFVRVLTRQDVDYKPEFISKATLKAILAGD